VAYDRVKYLPTVKRIPDVLWDEVRWILPSEKPTNSTGRLAVSFRMALYIFLECLKSMSIEDRCCQRNMALDQPVIDDSNNDPHLRYFENYGLDC
jgi:hypothetical protein